MKFGLITGRRKRVQTKNVVRTRAAVLSLQFNDIGSPMKKEIKLDNTKSIENDIPDDTCSISETHKSSMCISSFFYTQVCILKYLFNVYNVQY